MTDSAEDLVTMGRIGKLYGIKGWLKLISFTEPRDNILRFGQFTAMTGSRRQHLEMDQGREHGKGLIAHFAGYDDPEQALQLIGMELAVSADALPELEPDEYYWHELTGLEVFTSTGVLLGEVDTLLETGANDVLVVKATEASVDGRERLIPWLPDQVVSRISIDEKRIIVNWEPDYLA